MRTTSILLLIGILAWNVACSKLPSTDVPLRFSLSYGSNMVLQSGLPIHLWGFINPSTPQQSIKVYIEGCNAASDVAEAKVADGQWNATLPAREPSSCGHSVTASLENSNNVTLTNVLFGDVYVCGGQSNMQFTLGWAMNASAEIAAAGNFPNVRLMTAAQEQSPTPLVDLLALTEPWSVASPQAVGGNGWSYFSAVCWFFGRDLSEKTGLPIGLVASDWGGTPVEAWSSPTALKKCPGPGPTAVADPVYAVNSAGENVRAWADSGAIWYQGEANTGSIGNALTYACRFPAMIADWRSRWSAGTGGVTDPTFPFGFVQLAPWDDSDSNQVGGVPIVRWGQTANIGYVPNQMMPNTFMAVAADLGDPSSPEGDVHPRYKQQVGSRLTAAALQLIYGKDVYWLGPVPTGASQQGDDVIVTFRNVGGGGGLATINQIGFEVCKGNCSITAGTWIEAPLNMAKTKPDSVLITPSQSGTYSHAPCLPEQGPLNCCVYANYDSPPSEWFPAAPFIMSIA